MLASSVIHEADRAKIGADSLTIVGGLRRFAPDIATISLLGIAPVSHYHQVLKAFIRLPLILDIADHSPSSVTANTARGRVTLHLAPPEHAGSALVWHTGSRPHVELLQLRADRLGLRFTSEGLASSNGNPIPCTSETDMYSRLQLPYIAPEIRNGGAELEAAERGQLPRLISERDIRGDLHTHTTWSDGRNTLPEMVDAAQQLGYEYLAITDHSERAFSSRRLTARDVPRQRKELDDLRARIHGIDVLHGVEVDIMQDGGLDFDDELLEGFDIVLASLHDPCGQDGPALTERCLTAIRHPLVNVITHPANRAPGRFEGYPLDFDRLFTAAAESGTAMEIDGSPGHLDMDGPLARRAAAAGVTIVVDSDCHQVDALARQMHFGVGTARRGWIEPRHVLNTRNVTEIRKFVAQKRSRRDAR